MNSYLSGKGYYAKNVTGTSLSTLASTYIDSGNPVLVWGTVGMKEIDRIIQWQSDDRTESFLYPANEHCMVFSGYDGEKLLVFPTLTIRTELSLIRYPIRLWHITSSALRR